MKKFLALLLAVLMISSLLVACGGGDDKSKSDSGSSGGSGGGSDPVDEPDDPFYGEDNIKLLVWAADKAIDVTNKLCDEFKAQYPDKKIDITVQVQGEGDAAAQVLNDKDAAADVFSFACDQLNRLYIADALTPVSLYYNEAAIKDRNTDDSVSAAEIDGELYAFPETGDNGYYLVYDKSVVSDEDAETLEGVLAACKKAGRKFVLDAGNGFFSCMFPFTGGLRLDGIEDEVQQFSYDDDCDDDTVIDTLVDFANLFHEYEGTFMSAEATKISTGTVEPRTVAAGVDGSWNAAAVSKSLGDDFGAAKLPTVNGKQIYSMFGYKLIGVNSHTDFPCASLLLADYLTNKESQLMRAEELSWGPSNEEAVKDPIVTGNIALKAILDQGNNYGIPMVNIADTFWSPMGTLGNSLWKEADYSRDTIAKNYAKTIANIKDE